MSISAFRSDPNKRKKPDAEPAPQTTESGQPVYNRENYNEHDGTIQIDLNEAIIDQENVLLKYHNSTYIFTLYTMSAADFKLFQRDSSVQIQRYIIAQSGASARYSIGDVKMNSVAPGTPGKTTNSSMLQMEVNLIEQNGMNFLNDLVVLSNKMNYNKFADLPFVLEVKFVGYDQNSGVPTTIPGTEKHWKVRINTVKTVASEEGATMTHTLGLVALRNVFDSPAWILKEPFQCNVSTFGDFIQALEDKMNAMSMAQYGYLQGHIPLLADGKFFEFKVSEQLKPMPMVNDAKTDPESGKTTATSFGSRTFNFEAKTNISTAVDSAIDCCSAIDLQGQPDPENRQFVQIVPSVEYAGYDYLRATTVYRYTYFIVPFWTGDLKEAKDLKNDKFNLKYFIDNAPKFTDPTSGQPKLLAKRYDYQNTGLNSEIIHLDIKFDSQFYMATTRNPYNSVDTDNSSGTHEAQEISFDGNTYNSSSIEDVRAMNDAATKLKNKPEQTDEEKQFIRDADAAAEQKFAEEKSKAKVEGEDQQDEFTTSSGDSVYIEDFRDEYDYSEAGTASIGQQVQTIPTDTANVETNNSNTKGENSSPYEMYRRITKSNYYNRSFMMQLDMDVVGDPYWLGWSDDVFSNYAQAALVAQEIELKSGTNSANFLTSESYIVLNLKPASKISDETGIIDVRDDDVFSQTLYRILQINHEFSNGVFKQHLNGAIVIRSLRKQAE